MTVISIDLSSLDYPWARGVTSEDMGKICEYTKTTLHYKARIMYKIPGM